MIEKANDAKRISTPILYMRKVSALCIQTFGHHYNPHQHGSFQSWTSFFALAAECESIAIVCHCPSQCNRLRCSSAAIQYMKTKSLRFFFSVEKHSNFECDTILELHEECAINEADEYNAAHCMIIAECMLIRASHTHGKAQWNYSINSKQSDRRRE